MKGLSTLERLGNKVATRRWLFYLLNFTWGLPLTILGYVVLILVFPFGKLKKYGYVRYFEFHKRTGWGVSIGTIFFTTARPSEKLLAHEFGHCVQNAILGPFMFFVVSIPSFIRFWYRDLYFKNNKHYPATAYDDIWFEGSATMIGRMYSHIRTYYERKERF